MAIKTYLPVPPNLRNMPKNRAIRIVERRHKAMGLRRSGMSLEAIARECGVSMKTTQLDIYTCLTELVELTAQETDAYRELELQRMDIMIKAIWPKVEAGDLWAIDRAVMLADRRAKFLGLDKPMSLILAGDKDNPLQVEHQHSVDDALFERMKKLATIDTSRTAQLTEETPIEAEFEELPSP